MSAPAAERQGMLQMIALHWSLHLDVLGLKEQTTQEGNHQCLAVHAENPVYCERQIPQTTEEESFILVNLRSADSLCGRI